MEAEALLEELEGEVKAIQQEVEVPTWHRMDSRLRVVSKYSRKHSHIRSAGLQLHCCAFEQYYNGLLLHYGEVFLSRIDWSRHIRTPRSQVHQVDQNA